MSVSLLRQLLMKDLMKESAKRTGIMTINKNLSKDVEKLLQKYISSAQSQGVDLDTLGEQQLKYIIQLNKQPVDGIPQAISADSDEGRRITEALFGKQKAPVVDMTGKTIDTSQGIMGGKSVKELMDSGQITKGTAPKKSDKVRTRQMFKDSNLNETDAQIKARLDAGNKKSVKNMKNREMTADEIEDFEIEMGDLEPYDFDGTIGSANKIRKDAKAYEAEMYQQYKMGKLDPEAGDKSPARKKFLEKKLEEMEASGDSKLMTRDEIEELTFFDIIPEDMAKGGRAGYYGGGQAMVGEDLSEIGHGSDALMARNMQIAPGGQATTSTGLNYLLGQDNDTVRVPYQGGGGADASTTTFSKSYDSYSPGSNTASRANKSVDAKQAAGQRDADRTNDRISNTDRGREQALNNYIAIEYPEQKQNIIDKIKNSKYNNPYTRGIAKTAAYMYNPAFLGTDLRTLMSTKRTFDKFNKSPEQLEKEQYEKEMAEVGIFGLDAKKNFEDYVNTVGYESGINPEADALYNDYRNEVGLNTNPKTINARTDNFFNSIDGDTQYDYNISNSDIKDLVTGDSTKNLTVSNMGDTLESRRVTPSGVTSFDVPQPFGDPQSLSVQPYAEGGPARQNFAMGKRAFLKLLGSGAAGIAGLKTGLFGVGKKEAAKEVVKEVATSSGGTVPPYFLNLVKKIKTMGDDASNLATQDRQKVTKFKDYEMTEDISTGNIEILKKGDNVSEDVFMSLKVDDVPLKGKNKSTKVQEYEEYTATPDAEGKMKNIEQGVPDEVVQEGSVFEDTLSEFGKADGGRIGYSGGGILRAIIAKSAASKGLSVRDFIKATSYKGLPPEVKMYISAKDFAALKGGQKEMYDNYIDMAKTRLEFQKNVEGGMKTPQVAPFFKNLEKTMDEKSFVPKTVTADDIAQMELMVKNRFNKGRKDNATGGIATMLGE